MTSMYYATYLLGGQFKSHATIQILADFIYRQELSEELPCLLVERGLHAKANQFYLFVGIQTRFGNSLTKRSQTIYNILRKNPDFYLTFPEIRRMVGTEILIGRLPYIPPPDSIGETHHFSLDEAGLGAASQSAERFDRLLALLSAAGDGRWERFADACATLGVTSPDGVRASQVMRRLALLGHLGTDDNRERWSVAPAVLARVGPLATGLGITHVLCGRRDDALLTELGEVATLEPQLGQPEGDGPSVVGIVAPDEAALRQALRDHGGRLAKVTVTDASMELAAALQSLEQWKRSLPRIPGVAPDRFAFRWFNGTEFVARHFERVSGLWELETSVGDGAGRILKRVYYYDQESGEWLGGEFYGLRFLVQSTKEHVRVRHDPKNCLFEIHLRHRLPELYERALVLASGRLPERVGDARDVLRYRGVTSELATLLASKLGLEVEFTNE